MSKGKNFRCLYGHFHTVKNDMNACNVRYREDMQKQKDTGKQTEVRKTNWR